LSNRIIEILSIGKRDHELEDPAPKNDISKLIKDTSFELPEEYIEFLQTYNGGSGELPIQPCWYELWPASEVIENNESYDSVKDLPEFFAIGSNQGGELIYLDYRAKTIGNVVSIPLIPSDPDYANIIAETFDGLIPLLGLECKC